MKINHSAPTPPGKWRWRDPETGKAFFAFDASGVVRSVMSFLKNNGRPATEEEVEDQICQQAGLGPPYCRGSKTVKIAGVTLETVGRFFDTVKNWMASGMRMAPMEQVEARAKVCSTCPRNLPMGGCVDCIPELATVKAQDWVVPEDRRPELQPRLHNCQQCGCRLALKVQFATEAYKDDTAEYPEWCWMVKERKP
jgi:hypothetical protein